MSSESLYNVWCVRHKYAKPGLVSKPIQRPVQQHICRPAPGLPCATEVAMLSVHTGPDVVLPWITGRMCWMMVKDSAFFIHGYRREQEMVAGPSGHTHALFTFMRIFKNFDVEKWTLVCILLLVGADHHILFEVLTAAARHGLAFTSDHNSIDFTRALLSSIVSPHHKQTQARHRAGSM